jgi:transcriptional regulator with XRE-family HTH domain
MYSWFYRKGRKMSNIGDFLRQLRGKMPYREAAEKSGLSHSYIRYLEMGRRPGSNTPINPTPETLKSLSKAYNYSYDALMKLAGYIDGEGKLKDSEDEFIEGIDLELTDEEILGRFNIKVDGENLNVADAKDFIAFVRAKRSLK